MHACSQHLAYTRYQRLAAADSHATVEERYAAATRLMAVINERTRADVFFKRLVQMLKPQLELSLRNDNDENVYRELLKYRLTDLDEEALYNTMAKGQLTLECSESCCAPVRA
jgi:hypothetical protein